MTRSTEQVTPGPGRQAGAFPMVEGQALASSPYGAGGRAGARHPRQATSSALPAIAGNVTAGHARGFRRRPAASRSAARSPSNSVAARRRHDHADRAARRRRRRSASRRASSPIRSRRSSRSACRNSIDASSSCRSPRRRPSSTSDGEATAIEVFVDDPDGIDAMRAGDRRRRRAADHR